MREPDAMRTRWTDRRSGRRGAALIALLALGSATTPGTGASDQPYAGIAIATPGIAAIVRAVGETPQVALVIAYLGHGTEAPSGGRLVVASCRAGSTCVVERRGLAAGEMNVDPETGTARLTASTAAGTVDLSWSGILPAVPGFSCDALAGNGRLIELTVAGTGQPLGYLWTASVGGTIGDEPVTASLCASVAQTATLFFQVA